MEIGKQNANTIYNNERGYQVNNSPGATVNIDARMRIAELRDVLDELRLPPTMDAAAQQELDRADAALDQRYPDTATAAGALDRFTRLLSAAGAFAAAGQSLSGPLRALGDWLAAHSG